MVPVVPYLCICVESSKSSLRSLDPWSPYVIWFTPLRLEISLSAMVFSTTYMRMTLKNNIIVSCKTDSNVELQMAKSKQIELCVKDI